MLNQRSAADSVSKFFSVIQLNRNNPGWGFTKFMLLARLTDPGAGFLVGDRLRLKVEVVC